MTFCLPLAYWQEAQEKKNGKASMEEPLLGEVSGSGGAPLGWQGARLRHLGASCHPTACASVPPHLFP